MQKIRILFVFVLVSAFAKAQTVDAELITNIKQNESTEDSEITNITGTVLEGSLLYDSTQKNAYLYDGIEWRRVYLAPKVDAKTADYTLAASDDGNVLTFNRSTGADIILTIPTGLPTGFNISIYQLGSDQVQISSGGGVIVQNRLARFFTAGPGAGAGIINLGTDVFVVTGDLKKS